MIIILGLRYRSKPCNGWEILLIDNTNGKVQVDQIMRCSGIGFRSIPDSVMTREEKARRKYWETHLAPMDKIKQARENAEAYRKSEEEYKEKKSKLSPEDLKALEEAEMDTYASMLKGAIDNMKR